MRDEYDFEGAERGVHAARYWKDKAQKAEGRLAKLLEATQPFADAWQEIEEEDAAAMRESGGKVLARWSMPSEEAGSRVDIPKWEAFAVAHKEVSDG